MRMLSLSFAGYRSFAARSPAAPSRHLERIRIAPLTILLGRNNGGKSTVARLVHHALAALGADGNDPFPMSSGAHTFGSSFRDIQHGGKFFNPLDLETELQLESGAQIHLAAQLIQDGELDESAPRVVEFNIDHHLSENSSAQKYLGLLPAIDQFSPWRKGAAELLRTSCHIQPVRDQVRSNYDVIPSDLMRTPVNNENVAQLLLTDGALRAAVATWMSENLDGWYVDVKQSLDSFRLFARRSGRESNLADSGQGIQQVLPVIALCCWRSLQRGLTPFIDIIEQPELHLHDAAHAALGDLMLSAIADGKGNLIVETHSEELVLRVRRRVAEGLCPSNVAIVYVEDTGDGSRVKEIKLDKLGEVDWWPEGVFSESLEEVKAIRRAQRAREVV